MPQTADFLDAKVSAFAMLRFAQQTRAAFFLNLTAEAASRSNLAFESHDGFPRGGKAVGANATGHWIQRTLMTPHLSFSSVMWLVIQSSDSHAAAAG
jgi:hypothetical protein